jgi:hypothetical protein
MEPFSDPVGPSEVSLSQAPQPADTTNILDDRKSFNQA